MQQNLLSPPAVISVWLGTTSFIFVLNNTVLLNGRISAADGIQEENVKGVVRVNAEWPLFSFKGKMHLFQEVFSCKLNFVTKLFSSTGRRILSPRQELTVDLIYKLVEKDPEC